MLGDLITATSDPQPRRLRFTVDHYYKMLEMGMRDNYEKAEIIGGEMVQKMTTGDRHATAVNRLTVVFIKQLPDTYLVSSQNPLRMGEFDEPEPGIVIADLTKYDGKRHPRPEETILVVEVADKSLRYDRDQKLPMYAEAGIEEVWIVNLRDNVIEIHQQPSVGIYQIARVFGPGESVKSSVLPNLKLSVDEVLS
ncbi:MAG: Uma2 family endonuclease [Pyrinomonadaceae bacterium]